MFSRTKSVGRFARSVEIITQRPTIGSFLSSGTSLIPFREVRQTSYFKPPGRHSEILQSVGGDDDRHSIRPRYRTSTGTLVRGAADSLARPEPPPASYAGLRRLPESSHPARCEF